MNSCIFNLKHVVGIITSSPLPSPPLPPPPLGGGNPTELKLFTSVNAELIKGA